jgi:hypothetical protein
MSEATGMVWLVNRLRCMSVAEVGYRIQQAAKKEMARGLAKRSNGSGRVTPSHAAAMA